MIDDFNSPMYGDAVQSTMRDLSGTTPGIKTTKDLICRFSIIMDFCNSLIDFIVVLLRMIAPVLITDKFYMSTENCLLPQSALP